ncbi:MAG: hypothetical protein ABIG44_12285 [Planctomycetota bacterium]
MADWISSHRFWLRPDCVICLSIPENFTRQDAERLEKWVKTLPTIENQSRPAAPQPEIGIPVPSPVSSSTVS